MRPLLIDALVVVVGAAALVAAWKFWPMQQKATDVGFDFSQRHPNLSSLLLSLGVAAIGLVAAWRAFDLVATHQSVAVLLATAMGAAFGVAGFIVWAYSAAHDYLVAGSIGRLGFGLTLLFAAGAFGAVFAAAGYLPNAANGFCVSIVATRMLPWSVGLLWQAHVDARNPEMRDAKVMRSMILSTGHRPPKLAEKKHN